MATLHHVMQLYEIKRPFGLVRPGCSTASAL